jgi:hypothetical protein
MTLSKTAINIMTLGVVTPRHNGTRHALLSGIIYFKSVVMLSFIIQVS